MLTEGRVRAIAAQVASAIVRKFNPNISEEQIAAVQKNAESAIAAKSAAEEAAARAEEAANRLLGVAVVGVIDENGKIILTGLLEDGTYTAYYEVDGGLVEIGDLTIGAVTPEATTYTVTFVADGVTVDRVTYTEGDTELSRIPDVPVKDGYTGVWKEYTLSDTNITVNAVYTAIEIEPAEPKNFVEYNATNTTEGDTTIWVNQSRIKSDGSVTAETSTTYGVAVVSNFIRVQNGDVVYYEGFYTAASSSLLCNGNNERVKNGALKTLNTDGYIADLTESTSGNRTGNFTISNADVEYVRLGGFVRTTDTPVIKIQRNGEYLTA